MLTGGGQQKLGAHSVGTPQGLAHGTVTLEFLPSQEPRRAPSPPSPTPLYLPQAGLLGLEVAGVGWGGGGGGDRDISLPASGPARPPLASDLCAVWHFTWLLISTFTLVFWVEKWPKFTQRSLMSF